MKTMRKLFTVLLALAMTLALAVPAFAADTGSITITNPQGDHTYTAYKIFDVTYSGDHYSYTISNADPVFSAVKAYADVTANGLTLTPVGNTGKYNVSIDAAAFSAASFAQYLKTKVGSLGTGTAFTQVGDTVKASGLALGYYFVSGTSGTVCELATAKNIEIRDKNEVPEIKKDVNDDDRTVEIGQVLTYTATVNEKAIQRNEETNTATLKYSNDPANKDSFKESSVEVEVFSFNIVINKYAAGNESTKLEGAKFVLKNAEGKYYNCDTATKAVTWVVGKADTTEVTTDVKGVARFDGLQAGTYKLEETAAPADYNQLTKDITIVLNKDGSATIDSASSTLGADHSLTAGVANSTGTMLPETGGIGTVIFVALGALAVICAGVFLVTNKRMSKESF